MLHDYFRSVWHGVRHNKVSTFINIGGLVLGLMVFFALTFYVKREFSYDAHWQDADRIYRAVWRQEGPTGNTQGVSWAPYVLGTSLQSRNPDAFEGYARLYNTQATVTVDGAEFPNQSASYAEPALLELFQMETIEGSLQEVFADPRSIALTESTVEKFFGKQSPIGRTITMTLPQSKVDYVVKAVYRLPEPTSLNNLQLLGLLDPSALPVQNAALDLWSTPQGSPPQQQPLNVTHYFKLRQGLDPALPEADLRSFMDENRYMHFGDTKTRFTFQNLRDVHLSPGLFDASDSVRRLWVFEAIAMLVLLIGGCNFVMLATLRSVDRMREVGIRKTLGGEAGQLMRQYLLDAFCQTLVAACLAIALLAITLPILQAKLELSLAFDLLDWRNLALCLAIVIGFTLVSGAYPALLMSRGKPAALLRNSSGALVTSGNTLRRLLVAIQFAVVIVLLLASGVVHQQIEYTSNRDRGYSVENLLALRVNFELWQNIPALLTRFRALPGVQLAAVGGLAPSTIMISQPTLVRNMAPEASIKEAPVQSTGVGGDYFRTMSVAVLAGREFSTEIDGMDTPAQNGTDPPAMRNVVLNKSAAQLLGFTPESAVDRLLEIDVLTADQQKRLQSLRVIGVVADTQFSSVMLPPVPQYYGFSPRSGFLAVKLEPGADTVTVTDALKLAWTDIAGDVPFPQVPSAQITGNLMFREEFEARIITGSTILAMVIALMGLYGLVAATVTKRVKEIGVRKVKGANRTTIVRLLLWQFSKPVLVANLLAWPLGF